MKEKAVGERQLAVLEWMKIHDRNVLGGFLDLYTAIMSTQREDLRNHLLCSLIDIAEEVEGMLRGGIA